MSLKNATTLALAGTLVLTILMTADLLRTILAAARDLIPPLVVLRSIVYLFASLTATIFFYVFRREHS